jgi:DNA replication and repair protein RecF
MQNFRSYGDESFEFDAGVNIVVGPNASGKTNLLEAILLLARGSSYRARDSELIKHGKPWARLDGYFGSHLRTIKLTDGVASVKTYELDKKTYHRLGLERTVPVVLFEPNHLLLITRGPERRREYFDDLLERSQTGYKTLAAGYRRALAQRNALLKQGPGRAKSQLFAWNIRLSELGEKIAQARAGLIEDINRDIAKNYSRIAGRQSEISLEYDCQFNLKQYSSKLMSKLEAGLSHDFNRGFTAYGPHREDIIFRLNDQLAGPTASRGEIRSVLLVLKIYELELIKKVRGETPLFLLDDVFSELDSRRRRALVKYLKKHQTIITTTDADAVIEYFAETTNLIPL